MKKSINKLSLNKSTISNLSNSDLGQIQGGATGKCVPKLTNPCGTLACSTVCPTNGCSVACASAWCTIK
ncbi:MAG: class I lanthipeptide [Bacteroidetes bacterium]|jgi:hypothetical protein|nr:class I lanthipeptide [Bacteroidota bacterium]MBK9319152.1 class I lanthipeptide [Bacteroidota bacterium]